MRKIRILYIIIFLCTPFLSFSQHQFAEPYPGVPPEVLINTKAEGKSADNYEVDLYHGTVNVNIPIYEYNIDGLNLGVSLNYDCRGIKVDQTASTVGLGWTLSAGYGIERKLNGIEDEYVLDQLRGWDPFGLDIFERVSKIWGYNIRDAVSSERDKEEDAYTISLPGRNLEAQFRLFPIPLLNTFPNSRLDLESIISYKLPGNPNRLEEENDEALGIVNGRPVSGIGVGDSETYFRYNIIDEKGNKFIFDRGDYQYKTHKDEDWPWMLDAFLYYPVENWRIKEIIMVSGVRIKYYYKRIDNVSYPFYKDEKVKVGSNGIFIQRNQVRYWNGSITVLSMIEYPNGTKVHFNYNEDPNTQRYDVKNIPALNSIEIEQGYDENTINTIKYVFNYSYFHSPTSFGSSTELPYGLSLNDTRHQMGSFDDRNIALVDNRMVTELRLKLNSIDRISMSNETERYFSFEYNSVPLPPRLSPSQDFFGYYNNEKSYSSGPFYYENGNSTREVRLSNLSIPFNSGKTFTRYGLQPYQFGVSKSHNVNYMKSCVLEKIKNQYGGITSFIYKDHLLKNYDNVFVVSNYGVKMPELDGQNVNDGLCIDMIKYEDGYHSDNNYSSVYCFGEGVRFFNGGYMRYVNFTKDYEMYVFLHNYNISKHIYHQGFNHGYGIADVISFDKNNQEISRDRFKFSNIDGPLFGPPNGGGVRENLKVYIGIHHETWGFDMDYNYVPTYFNRHNLGLLLKHSVFFPASNQVRSENTYNYISSNGSAEPFFIKHYSMGYKDWATYQAFLTVKNNLSKEIKEISERGGTAQRVSSFVDYKYDLLDNIKSIQWKDSKRDLFEKRFFYSYEKDVNGNYPYSGLLPNQKQYLTLAETWKVIGSNSYLADRNEFWASAPYLGRHNVFKSLKTTSPVLNGTSAIITEDRKYTVSDDCANTLETRYDGQDIYSSSIWDTRIGMVTAEAKNARYDQIAYTSFEGPVKSFGTHDFNKGNWDYYPSDIKHKSVAPRLPVTGNYILNLNPNSSNKIISLHELTTGKQYMLTFWANRKPYIELVPDGLGSNDVIDPELMFTINNGWNLYSVMITGNGKVLRLTNNHPTIALQLDELRLHPIDASMITTTYEPLWGPNSKCDERHNITYYEYDAFGRLKIVRDRDQNIILMTREVVQGADN